jgi:hypothetical protein
MILDPTPWISSPRPGSLSRCPSSLSSLSRAWHYCNLGLLEVVLNRMNGRHLQEHCIISNLGQCKLFFGACSSAPKLTPILSVTVLSSCSSTRAPWSRLLSSHPSNHRPIQRLGPSQARRECPSPHHHETYFSTEGYFQPAALSRWPFSLIL